MKIQADDYDLPALVTGASGFIGCKVVEKLLDYGFSRIRCFVRPSSQLTRLTEILKHNAGGTNVELVRGDLLSRDDCAKAVEGITIIYHLAAGIEKSFAGAFMNSVVTTRNLLDAFLSYTKPKRFVNVSSFAVYSNLDLRRGALLDESCPLQETAQARDAYSYAKLKQDELVQQYGQHHGLPYVVIRPGAVFGPGKKALSGRVGIDTFGFFIHVGNGNTLPLTYVDNCAEAIVLAGIKPGADGEVFNVVDDDLPTSSRFLRAYASKVAGFSSLRVPYRLAYLGCLMWEKYAEWSEYQLPPVFNRRRCAAEWKGNRYSNSKLKERLGWKPRVNMHDAMTSFLSQF